MDAEMQPFVVTLDRPRVAVSDRGATSLEDGVMRTRGLVEGFRQALHRVIRTEGLADELASIEAARNLPMLFVVGTDRLADRMRRMDGVRGVARDQKLPVQIGYRR